MAGPQHTFQINESQSDGFVQLHLTGDLDLSATPALEDRLGQLRAEMTPVRINLGQLDFIDSTGLNVLLRAVGDARRRGWKLYIEHEVSEQVLRMFNLMHVAEFLLGRDAPGLQTRQSGSTSGAAPEST